MLHSDCKSPNYTKRSSSKYRINLLHTCRQICNEARFIPYSTNTFCFNTSRNLRAFIHVLNQRGVNVNEAVRSLRIDLAHVSHDLHGWTQAFNAVAQRMTLLETISINVDQKVNWSWALGSNGKDKAMKPVLDCLAVLGKTPVQFPTIFVGDRWLSTISDARLKEHPAMISRRWTLKKKREWVDKVKLAI